MDFKLYTYIIYAYYNTKGSKRQVQPQLKYDNGESMNFYKIKKLL